MKQPKTALRPVKPWLPDDFTLAGVYASSKVEIIITGRGDTNTVEILEKLIKNRLVLLIAETLPTGVQIWVN